MPIVAGDDTARTLHHRDEEADVEKWEGDPGGVGQGQWDVS